MSKSSSVKRGARLLLAAGALVAADCSSNSTSNGGGADSPAGVVLGPLDNHCTAADGGLTVQTVGVCEVVDTSGVPSDTSICSPVTFTTNFDAGGGDDSSSDAGVVSDYGATMYGSAGNDDDCKYYVSWTSTAIKEGQPTYFTVTALRLADMQPVHCAGIRPDTSLSVTHGVPAPSAPSPEIAPGVYKVGPIVFDAPGIWTERFHLFEECSDDPDDSPHGHAAFFINVP